MMFNSRVQLSALLQCYQLPAGDAVTQVIGLTHLGGITPRACKSFLLVSVLKAHESLHEGDDLDHSVYTYRTWHGSVWGAVVRLQTLLSVFVFCLL